MINYLTIEEIEEIIDRNMIMGQSFMFVVGRFLSDYIMDYLKNEYGLYDQNHEIESGIDEYCISMYFPNYDQPFTCESAKGSSGNYKLCDLPHIDYYISVNMSDSDIRSKLKGEGSNRFVFRLVEEDVCDCDECCGEDYDDLDLVDIYTERILESQGCPSCIREALEDLVDDILD